MADKKLVSIQTLAGEFKTNVELQAYCDSQYHTIKALTAENEFLQSKIKHLEGVVSLAVPLVPKSDTIRLEVPVEHEICEIQIKKLQEKAQVKELTLEETKRLEILIKSLYLIKDKNQGVIDASFTNLDSITNVDSLLQIASTPNTELEPSED